MALVTAFSALGLSLWVASGALASIEPTKFVFSSHVGQEVDLTTHGKICTVVSKDTCTFGNESGRPGGFLFPETMVAAPSGNVYVGDTANHRIQEFTSSGEFVLMFGYDVNVTAVKAGAPQAQRNRCTATEVDSGAECLAGSAGDGTDGAMLSRPSSITIDPSTGNIYVYDEGFFRVDEFTPTGEFILMIGGDVNSTKDALPGASESETNVCAEASKDLCAKGVESAPGSIAHGAFKAAQFEGNLLSVGGPANLLYVGDEGRIQKFSSTGLWEGEIPLDGISTTGGATALGVNATGEIFVSDSDAQGVHVYSNSGELQSQVIDPGGVHIVGLALDAYNRIGLIERTPTLGLIFTSSGTLLGEFTPPSGEMAGIPKGLAFDRWEPAEPLADRLYVPEPGTYEYEVYSPVVFPEANTCEATNIASTSATLCGEIDPNGLQTRGFFVYTPPSSTTPVAFEGEGTAFVSFQSGLMGLEPNQTYRFATVAEAEAEGKAQQQVGQQREFHTTTPPPEIPETPTSTFVTSHSAVLRAKLNPEHALTSYHFEYGPCLILAECAPGTIGTTESLQASAYAVLGVTQEIDGLDPNTTYSYRLVANNSHEEVRGGKPTMEGGEVQGAEGSTFTTSALALPTVQIGAASNISTSSARLSAMVNPDGQPAVYVFELGIDAGDATPYSPIVVGDAGGDAVAIERSFTVTGLQPGTRYAYRVKVEGGQGEATSVAGTFVTNLAPYPSWEPTISPILARPPYKFPAGAVKKTKIKKVKKVKNKKATHHLGTGRGARKANKRRVVRRHRNR
jgi:hypothetical protein